MGSQSHYSAPVNLCALTGYFCQRLGLLWGYRSGIPVWVWCAGLLRGYWSAVFVRTGCPGPLGGAVAPTPAALARGFIGISLPQPRRWRAHHGVHAARHSATVGAADSGRSEEHTSEL